MTDFRIALIGYGTAGAIFHAPLIAATPGLALAAIVTRRQAEAARAAYPEAAILESAESLWARADAFDAVVIATPNATHVSLAHAAIEAGLAVIIDKPMAAHVAEADALMAAARRADVALTVFHNRRWDSDFLTVADLIARDALGDIRRFESRFERWRPEAKPGWKRDTDRAAAGGILFDLGSHLIDQTLALFGPVANVAAEVIPRYDADGVDDDTFVALEHTGGVRSHLWMSSVAPLPAPRLRVIGARAGYEKYGMDPQEDVLRAGGSPTAADWGHDPIDGRLGAGEAIIPHATMPGDYGAFYRGVRDALAGRAPMPVAPETAREVLRIIEAARTSHAERRVVELGRAVTS
ncbi:MAG: oxidoreductase [Xanthomonadales bacterium]|nr:oxidoreductase [Xanthomonadales bacterium]